MSSLVVWVSKGWKFEYRSTCLREAASAKAGEIRNKPEFQMFQIRNITPERTGFGHLWVRISFLKGGEGGIIDFHGRKVAMRP
jgi:hypothetical protein